MARVNGFSEAANTLERASRRQSEHFNQSVTFSKQPAYDDLWDVWQECKEPNWDGYDAVPVDQETYRNAYLLIEALPLGGPLPSSVGAEPDGHLALEWHRHPRCGWQVRRLHWLLQHSTGHQSRSGPMAAHRRPCSIYRSVAAGSRSIRYPDDHRAIRTGRSRR